MMWCVVCVVVFARYIKLSINVNRRVSAGENGAIRMEREFISEKYCKYRNVMNVNWHTTHPELLLAAYSEPEAGTLSLFSLLSSLLFSLLFLFCFEVGDKREKGSEEPKEVK